MQMRRMWPNQQRWRFVDYVVQNITSFHSGIWAVLGNYFIFQEEKKELDEITAKRQKRGKNEDESPAEEKTILHGIGHLLILC